MSLKSVSNYFKNEILSLEDSISKLEKKINDNNLMIRESELIIVELEKEINKTDRISPLYVKKSTDKIAEENKKIISLKNDNSSIKDEIALLKKKKTKLNSELKIVNEYSDESFKFVSHETIDNINSIFDDLSSSINSQLDTYYKIISASAYSDPSRTIIEFEKLKKSIDKIIKDCSSKNKL